MWKNSSPNNPQKKWYSKSTNRCSCEKQRGESFKTLTASLGLRICYFNTKILSHDLNDVDHMYENFQVQKIHTKIIILQSLGNDSPLCFSQLHLLVDLECHFFVGLLDLNFFHMFKKHRDVPTPKNPCEKKIYNLWEGVKVGSYETFLIATPC
jgi:hypothetical protein